MYGWRKNGFSTRSLHRMRMKKKTHKNCECDIADSIQQILIRFMDFYKPFCTFIVWSHENSYPVACEKKNTSKKFSLLELNTCHLWLLYKTKSNFSCLSLYCKWHPKTWIVSFCISITVEFIEMEENSVVREIDARHKTTKCTKRRKKRTHHQNELAAKKL